jgi:DNA-binding SARP family transcriptional activator/TolB-like protein
MAREESDRHAAPLSIKLLGGCEARRADGSLIDVEGKAALLLAVLALRPGHLHGRDVLTGLLWSDRADVQARASLRQTLWTLRKALHGIEPDPLCTTGDSVLLDASSVAVDVGEFETLVSQGTPDALLAAAALYRGDLLQGVRMRDRGVEAFVVPERERLHAVAQTALKRLLESPALDDRPQQAIEVAHRLIALDPLEEAAHRVLMALWARQGRNDLALGQYRTCVSLLERELGTAPQPETERLAAEIGDGRILRSPHSRPTLRGPPVPRRPTLQALAGLAAVLVVSVGVAVAYFLPAKGLNDGAAPGPASAVPPALLVLPVSDLHDDYAGAALIGDLTDDLALDLSRVVRHPVITLGQMAAATDSLPEAGYVLRGSVSTVLNRLRFNFQLIDQWSGQTLWADRYEGTASDAVAVQAAARAGLVTAVPTLIGAHHKARLGTRDPVAAVYFAKGWQHYLSHRPKAYRAAVGLFQRALARDRQFGRANAALAAVYWQCWLDRCHEDLHLDSRFAAWDEADAFLHLVQASPTALVHQVVSSMLLEQGRHEQAVSEAEAAVALDPNDSESHVALARALALSGRPASAFKQLAQADELNPQPTALHLRALGEAYHGMGRFTDAIQALKRASDANPYDRGSLALLTAAYGQLGLFREASSAHSRLTELLHRGQGKIETYSIKHAEFEFSFRLASDQGRFLDGLRKAGLPR